VKCSGCWTRELSGGGLSEKYPPFQTCHRRVPAVDSQREAGGGAEAFGAASVCGGKLNLEEAFVDVTFASANNWALPLVLSVVARGRDRRYCCW
jgi:hypothetical protein